MAIKIYTTPSCTYCTKAKKYLKENHVPFTEFNVAKDMRRLARVRGAGAAIGFG